MRIPLRAQNFAWRLMNRSLPTKPNLQKRGIRGTTVCPRCWEKEETDSHLFRDCTWARRFWFISPFTLRTETATNTSLQQWVQSMLNLFGDESGGLFLCCLHAIWLDRNKIIFDKKHSRPEALLEKAHQAYTEATKADLHVPLLQRTHPESQSANNWRAPEQGRYKVNVNAAIINDRRGGVGVVIRDWEGVVVLAATLEVAASFSVREAEAWAIFMGLSLAAQGYFLEVEVEGDNVEVIQALKAYTIFCRFFWHYHSKL
ncbi:uncharacterized protein LOC130980657 [Arachis stenosperma]|uniref:uncharacterized protein LOC130980657 n=1 Tax=Arachis stenosperma TaxID=217475 RepID=UPI0025ACFF4C|nr:uncharacterized protein LOC130980657 [Arachis stenosperma]